MDGGIIKARKRIIELKELDLQKDGNLNTELSELLELIEFFYEEGEKYKHFNPYVFSLTKAERGKSYNQTAKKYADLEKKIIHIDLKSKSLILLINTFIGGELKYKWNIENILETGTVYFEPGSKTQNFNFK